MTAASAWLDRFFARYYERAPVSATFIGVHEFDERLPDLSPASMQNALDEIGVLLTEAVPGEATDDPFERIDLLLARRHLEIERWEIESGWHWRRNPSHYTGEAVFGVVSLFLRDYASFDRRVRAAESRLRAIPAFLEQAIENLRVCPDAWVERAISECEGADALLSVGLPRLLAEEGVAADGLNEAVHAARSAFAGFRRFLVEDVARTHDDYGCSAEEFTGLMRNGHLLDMDAVAIQRYAQAALDSALEDTRSILADLAPGMSVGDIPALLGDDRQSPETYDGAYRSEWESARSFAIERDLVTWPEYPIEFEPIPEWAREAAPHLYFLYYRAPAPFDAGLVQRYLYPPLDRATGIEVQERTLRAVNTAQIRLNHIIHHAGLGHHVQNYYAYTSRSRVGQIAGVDAATRIAMFCAGTMVEGWACYATDLMEEAGYITPLERLAMAHGRARMATRAVVDASLHGGEMSLADATRLYIEQVGMSEPAACTEAVRNSMFPGSAMMYLIGTDLIHQLRYDMEQRWGSAFSLRRFHDTLLSYGSIPIAVVARAMRGEPLEPLAISRRARRTGRLRETV